VTRRTVRNVLIFAHECAPYNRPESTIGAQRPAQFAKHLAEFGWRAIVLCRQYGASPLGSAQDVRNRVAASMRASAPDESVIIPLPAPSESDWFDRAWAFSAVPGARQRLLALPRKGLTLARFFVGDYSRSWRPVARDAARDIGRRMTVDLCLGEHTPDAGLFLARWFAGEAHVPWLMDFRDPILFGYPPRVRPLLEPFARQALSGVSRIITVTPACRDIDESMFRVPVDVITNGFDPSEFSNGATYARNKVFTVAYTGGVWLEDALRIFMQGLAFALMRVEPGTLTFRYRGPSSDLVRRVAVEAGVISATDVGSHVSRDSALNIAITADQLVLFTPSRHPDPYWKRGVYPGKTFEYFGARRPILGVPGDDGILNELLSRTRTGTVARDANEVSASLVASWDQWRDTGAVPYYPDEAEVRRYTRREGAGLLARILDEVVDRAVPREVDTPRATAWRALHQAET
jgi:hypothetical protein